MAIADDMEVFGIWRMGNSRATLVWEIYCISKRTIQDVASLHISKYTCKILGRTMEQELRSADAWCGDAEGWMRCPYAKSLHARKWQGLHGYTGHSKLHFFLSIFLLLSMIIYIWFCDICIGSYLSTWLHINGEIWYEIWYWQFWVVCGHVDISFHYMYIVYHVNYLCYIVNDIFSSAQWHCMKFWLHVG